jgi:hypothetical protein
MGGSLLWCFGLGLIVLLWPAAALARPVRIIILRHAEKLNRHELCDLGEQRAEALAAQFLGQGATQSLFKDGQKPEAFLAITAHTIETITPAAQSWNLPVIPYTVSAKKHDEESKEEDLIRSTQDAAHDVLTDPRYAGKVVVITWEHNHIAKAKLEKDHPDEQVTFRQLLHLDQLADVPKTWPDSNYDYFWIVDYAPDNPVPSAFQMVRQAFTAPFDKLPANEWGEPEPGYTDAGCKK